MFKSIKCLMAASLSVMSLLVSCTGYVLDSDFSQIIMSGEGESRIVTEITTSGGGSYSVSLSDWNVKSSAEWCVVFKNPEKGGGFTVMVEKNPSTKESRIANVVMVTKTYPKRRSCVLSVLQSPAESNSAVQ